MAKYRRRKRPPATKRRPWCEFWGVILLVGGVFCWLAVFSDSAGVVGGFLAEWLYVLFGSGARAVWVAPLAAGLWLVAKGQPLPASSRVIGLAALAWLALIALHLPVPVGLEFDSVHGQTYGGVFGAVGARTLVVLFGVRGRAVVMAGLAIIAALAVVRVPLARAVGMVVGTVRWLAATLGRQLSEFVSGYRRVTPPERPARASFTDTGNGRLIRADVPDVGRSPTPKDARAAAEQRPPAGEATRAGSEAQASGAAAAAAQALPSGQGRPKATPEQLNASGVHSAPPVGLAAGPRPRVPDSYTLPPLSLLSRGTRQGLGRAAQDAETRAQLLEETFASFGVQVKVMEINPGPTVTRFEVRPAPGVKVARIEALAEDVALSLAAADVRIAPIPGKGLVGVEVPNAEISVVHLRELLESAEFSRAQSRLTFALGKDIAGQAVVGDLERLLHLLIAGATGSGKSVCLNALIASILFKARPDEVKLLLIDPKVVELQVFDGIPHLLAPVITDPKKSSQILRWAVKEMLDRYYRFSEVGVRNIADYNKLMGERQQAAEDAAAAASEDARMPVVAGASAAEGSGFPLPRIVIVIDELADLMMVAPVEVEDSIWRLAQMARAAGIHLVVATQRPSVNVITGVIKANIPSRVAFAVASQVDSRTILDMGGADKLLGRGDMLFYPVGAAKPIRAQGALITDREVEDLVRYVKNQGDPAYMESFPLPDESSSDRERQTDSRWADALRVVFDHEQASTSMLQRRLRIGYTRAARIVDMMEEMGIVAKSDGVKPRDVLMSIEQYTERYGSLDQEPNPH